VVVLTSELPAEILELVPRNNDEVMHESVLTSR